MAEEQLVCLIRFRDLVWDIGPHTVGGCEDKLKIAIFNFFAKEMETNLNVF